MSVDQRGAFPFFFSQIVLQFYVIDFCRLTSTLNDLNEERQLGKALRHNQQQWQVKISKLEEKFNDIKAIKEREIGELKEQVRDLMFFIDAQRVSKLCLNFT